MTYSRLPALLHAFSRRAATFAALALLLAGLAPAESWSNEDGSGTERGGVLGELFRHRQAQLRGEDVAALTAEPRLLNDEGDIAVIDTSSGVLADYNLFDLEGLTIRLTPSGEGFAGAAAAVAFDQAALDNGVSLALGDDDVQRIDLAFDFPYFGKNHRAMYVHSDGNVTFEEPDAASTDRTFSRAATGPPRIAPYFVDLDPSRTEARVRAYNLGDSSVITWEKVPQYSSSGTGRPQTFQLALHADGRIEMHYRTANLFALLVGVFPGRLRADVAPRDLSAGFAEATAGGVAEEFALLSSLDVPAAAQKFFMTHGDAYDFIAFFNNFGLPARTNVVAYELNVRNDAEGIGGVLGPVRTFDFGSDFGSDRRLVSVLNMGPLQQYPADSFAVMPLAGENHSMSLLAHEFGHRWLAYTQFLHPVNEDPSLFLLGRDLAHWSFFYNTEASVLEGNRIEDYGEGVSPRFKTVETVRRYSPLDLYLMGLTPPSETAPSFLVENPTGAGRSSRAQPPRKNVSFNGTRLNVSLDDIVAYEGPRRPDHTVSPKEFRMAFVLVIDDDAASIPQADLDKINRLRNDWKAYFEQLVGDRAIVQTQLVKRLDLSAQPYSGVLLGGAATASVSIDSARQTNLTVSLATATGVVAVPPSVVIPAGQLSVAFAIQGVSNGVDTLTATAAEGGYDSPAARIQVSSSPAALSLSVIEGDGQSGADGELLAEPIVFEVRDSNRVPYGNLDVQFQPSGGGQADPASVKTDAYGRAQTRWRLASSQSAQTLTARLAGAPSVAATASANSSGGRPQFSAAGVVNAASFNVDPPGENLALAPGGLISLFGVNLAGGTAQAGGFPLPRELGGAEVRINGVPAPLVFASPGQINLQVPFELPEGTAAFRVAGPGGESDAIAVAVGAAQPGIFADPNTGFGAILYASDWKAVSQRDAAPGEALMIFATGLGAVRPAVESGEAASNFTLSDVVATVDVLIGNARIDPLFAGLAPGFAGLYQVNAKVPAGAPAGETTVTLETQGLRSNRVKLRIAGQ